MSSSPEWPRGGSSGSISRTDLSTSIAHYYRGELARMTSWRDRIDRTTNWAIGAVAAMLSVSLSTPTAHHGVLLFAMLLVLLLLGIEARRYRFFDVYRNRVRLLERHYFGGLFGTGAANADAWTAELASSLREPCFTISFLQAFARRLQRNYAYIFLILLLAWVLKTTTNTPEQGELVFVRNSDQLFANARLGYIPGWLVVVMVALLYATLVALMLRHRERTGELAYGDVHV